MCTRSFWDRPSRGSTRSNDRVTARRWIAVILAGAALWAAPAFSFAQSDTAARRPFIGRILGVFDALSGEPVEGVEIFDMLSKSSALTTTTGTVALSFVDSGGSIIRLRKLGYEAQLLTVSNRADDVPITAVLRRSGVVLPTVTTKAARQPHLAAITPPSTTPSTEPSDAAAKKAPRSALRSRIGNSVAISAAPTEP